jgi:multidrug resistance protein, MATE family
MITIERIKTISKLAFPIGIALSSTLMLAVIDLAMVGRLGNNATAAVGLSVFSYSIVLAFVAGIVPAVQGLVARRRGEGSTEPDCLPLNGGLLIALVVGILLTLVCYLCTPLLFSLISSDPEVTKIGVPFLKILSITFVAGGIINAFDGYWSGLEMPKVLMLIGLLMNCLNAFGDYVLIFGHFGAPALGATGSAISTALSLYVGVITSFAITYSHCRKGGFVNVRPEWSLLTRIFKLGLPATVMQFFFWAGSLVFLWLVGRVGTAELAASNVLLRIAIILTLLPIALGNAAATLVSKTLGEGDLVGAARWGWDAGKLGVIGISLLGLPLVLFPRLFLSFFLTDPHTILIAVIPLRLVAATSGVGSLVHIFMYILYSVGDGYRVTMISFSTQWIFYLPAVWFVGPYLHHGLLHIWLVQAAWGSIVTVLITAVWADGRWKTIKI